MCDQHITRSEELSFSDTVFQFFAFKKSFTFWGLGQISCVNVCACLTWSSHDIKYLNSATEG